MMPVFYFITVSKYLEKWHLALWRVLDIYKCGASRRNQAPALALTNSMKKGKRKAPTERCSRLTRLANHRFTRARAFFRINPFLSFEFFVQVRSLRCAFSCGVAYPHFCISIKTTPILPTNTNRFRITANFFEKNGETRSYLRSLLVRQPERAVYRRSAQSLPEVRQKQRHPDRRHLR